METILILDDDPAVDVLQGMLESEHYTTLLSSTGKNACVIAFQHPGEIHLLIVNEKLQDGNGFQAAEDFRRVRPATKVLQFSRVSGRRVAEESQIVGVSVLANPFTREQLLFAVRKTLGEP